jgi:AcrR family transcriptional regulator
VATDPDALWQRRFTEDQLLDAALATFDQRGYQGAQMAEIAHRASTTKPTLYARLGGKEEIYIRVVEREGARFASRLAGVYKDAATLPLHGLVELAVRGFYEFASAEPASFKLLFRSEIGGPALEIGRRALDDVIDSITELVSAVFVRAGKTPGKSVQLLAAATAGVAVQVSLYAVDRNLNLDAAETVATTYIEAAMRAIDLEALAAIDNT